MKRHYYSVLAVSILLLSCSHSHGPVHKLAHDNIIQELKERNTQRSPASVKDEINAQLEELKTLSPNQFEVYVFPKNSNQNSKTALEADTYLGRPLVYEVSILAVNPCRQFTQNNLFGELKAKEAFSASDESKQCSILQFESKKLKTLPKNLLKKDDLLKVRLFVDEDYMVLATDYELFESRNKSRVSRIKGGSGSGLHSYPIDLPQKNSRLTKADLTKYVATRIDGVARFQIQKRLNRKFAFPQCQGAIIEQKGSFGDSTILGWCHRMPWPHFSENSRFLSIIQPISVK